MRLPSPYNFVPLADTVYFPEWHEQVSHDVPCIDGLCGSFEIELVARTAIYVRNTPPSIIGKHPKNDRRKILEDNEYQRFFRVCPGGPFAVPGTTLRGALATVLRVATFGRFGPYSHTATIPQTRPPKEVKVHRGRLVAADSHGNRQNLDFVDLLFGHVPEKNEENQLIDTDETPDALKGRVWIEPLLAMGEPSESDEVIWTRLDSPQAAYVLGYLEQPGADPDGWLPPGVRPKNYWDPNSEIRGWKLYPLGDGSVRALPNAPTNIHTNEIRWDQATCFRPLQAEARFRGRIVVHNIRAIEFGALLWALDFGGAQDCRHKLGMAKAYNYGIVELDWANVGPTWKIRRMDSSAYPFVDRINLVAAFTQHMKLKISGWERTAQIQTLLAMCQENHPAPSDLRHATPAEINASKGNPARVLLPFLPPAPVTSGAVPSSAGPSAGRSSHGSVTASPKTQKGDPAIGTILPESEKTTKFRWRLLIEGTALKATFSDLKDPPDAAPGIRYACVITSAQGGSYTLRCVRRLPDQ